MVEVRRISHDSPLWKPASDLEAGIFIERGYVESKEELAEEYKKYLDKTEMLVAIKKKVDGQLGVVACARVKDYSPTGFKTTDDANNPDISFAISENGWSLLEDISPSDMYEVQTTAAMPSEGAEIYGAIISYGLDSHPPRPYAIASLDEIVYRKVMKFLFDDAISELGDAVDYVGSPTRPILINLQRCWENARERSDQGIFSRQMFDRIAVGRTAICRTM